MALNDFLGNGTKMTSRKSASASEPSQPVSRPFARHSGGLILRFAALKPPICCVAASTPRCFAPRDHGLFPAGNFLDDLKSGVSELMRWLFIAVLVILVGCVLSIIWLNDAGLGRIEVTQPQPQNPLAPPPGTP
ncbi:hypothetical protein [Neorhizobium vignae]|uniref:hypothetical protein n=1 Tax=Neorhizobium vignae TaxID=690585 RepID=UPI001268E657|nr:hypothetical protein [Neorhizobium vignae]